jgi:hypothetical protein
VALTALIVVGAFIGAWTLVGAFSVVLCVRVWLADRRVDRAVRATAEAQQRYEWARARAQEWQV